MMNQPTQGAAHRAGHDHTPRRGLNRLGGTRPADLPPTWRAPRTVNGRTVRGLAALALTAAAVLPTLSSVGCGHYDETVFDPRQIQRDERQNPATPIRPQLQQLPTTLEATPRIPRGATSLPSTLPTTGASVTDMEVVRLPLREVLQRAVANSSEVRVAGYDVGVAEARVVEADGRFDPRAFANFQFQRVDQPGLGIINPFGSALRGSNFLNTTRSDTVTAAAGIKQFLVAGGQASISYQSEYNYANPRQFQQSNSFWQNQLMFELDQPLLQNFGAAVNAAQIRIARDNQRISVLDFRKTLEENLFELEKDYWQLYQAAADVQIEEDLLLGTIQTYSTLYDRWLRGVDASLIPVRQAESAVHQRKALLIQAKQQVRDLSADMKRRMNDPQFPVSGQVVLLPLTPPLVDPINFDTHAMVESALENRFELGQQLWRIDSADITLLVAKNNELPKLDLTLQLAYGGIAESLGNAFSNQGDFNHLNATVGLQFEYPLANREARAIYRRAQLQRYQAIEQYRALTAQVTLDVIQALNQIDSTWEQIGTRQQARLAAADAVRLIQEQEDIGGRPLTPEFVNTKLTQQENLAEARRQEAVAIAAYNNAIQQLERAKGTLLRYNNILIDEDQGGRLQPRQ